ncbi:hypothetical protein BKA70DRAFT_1559256 [Coprinopsis sp. MPI-PUGE-AT-0042]|nr:hypothetical protein BKA70DRAFT_1559256 [Coprinopsis sp. MPI-PUGE-AT-0042]
MALHISFPMAFSAAYQPFDTLYTPASPPDMLPPISSEMDSDVFRLEYMFSPPPALSPMDSFQESLYTSTFKKSDLDMFTSRYTRSGLLSNDEAGDLSSGELPTFSSSPSSSSSRNSPTGFHSPYSEGYGLSSDAATPQDTDEYLPYTAPTPYCVARYLSPAPSPHLFYDYLTLPMEDGSTYHASLQSSPVSNTISPSHLYLDAIVPSPTTVSPHHLLLSHSLPSNHTSPQGDVRALTPAPVSPYTISPAISPEALYHADIELDSSGDEDDDDDYHMDDEDDDEDDWMPSTSARTSKPRRVAAAKAKKAPSSKSNRTAPRRKTSNTTKKALLNDKPKPNKRSAASSRCKSRLPQAEGAMAVAIQSLLDSPDMKTNGEAVCPMCPHLKDQTRDRKPDFKRHLLLHLRPDDSDETQGWWCKGITYELFKTLKKSEQQRIIDRSGGETYNHLGVLRIGGCRATFSRRDALKRHLNKMNTCFGDVRMPHEL